MILVTGAAGFIGMHTTQTLLNAGHKVIGIDSMNSYYDPSLKAARLKINQTNDNFKFAQLDIAEPGQLNDAVEPFKSEITHVVHLAAQAGVRYSIDAPRSYMSNIVGTHEILELCRNDLPNLKHLVYASSSSVYGVNKEQPSRISQKTDSPVSLYAATKKSCEVIAESYSQLYKIPMTGLRFFTVYGPWGRPDMAYFKFTENILKGKPIQVFNNGDMRRDFTYVDDIVSGITAVMDHIPAQSTPHNIYNLGNNNSEKLMDMIGLLENYLGNKAIIEMLPMQQGDVYETYADISDSIKDFGFNPKTSLQEGLKSFVGWHQSFYGSPQ
jgi:UDP-glucuronate 4-epimerase